MAMLVILLAALTLVLSCMVHASDRVLMPRPGEFEPVKQDMLKASSVPLAGMPVMQGQEEVVLPPPQLRSASSLIRAPLPAPAPQHLVPAGQLALRDKRLIFQGGQLLGPLAPELAVRPHADPAGVNTRDSEVLAVEGLMTSRPQDDVVIVQTPTASVGRRSDGGCVMKLYFNECSVGPCGVLLETTGFAGEAPDPVAFVNTSEAFPKTGKGWGFFGSSAEDHGLSPRYASVSAGGPQNPPFAIVHAIGAITCPLGHPLRATGDNGASGRTALSVRCHSCGQDVPSAICSFGCPECQWVCCDNCRSLEGGSSGRGSLHSWVMRGCTPSGAPGPHLMRLTRSGPTLNVASSSGALIGSCQEEGSHMAAHLLQRGQDLTPRDLTRRRTLRIGYGADMALVMAAIVAVEKLS